MKGTLDRSCHHQNVGSAPASTDRCRAAEKWRREPAVQNHSVARRRGRAAEETSPQRENDLMRCPHSPSTAMRIGVHIRFIRARKRHILPVPAVSDRYLVLDDDDVTCSERILLSSVKWISDRGRGTRRTGGRCAAVIQRVQDQ